MKEKIISFFSLFGSSATLICCALPATIAAVAGGSAVVSLISAFPFLIIISQNKDWIFLGAGLLLIFNGIITLKPKGKLACSVTGGKGCKIAGKFQKYMFWFSSALFIIGGFMAYLAVHLIKFIDYDF